jgi:hypothetical protein
VARPLAIWRGLQEEMDYIQRNFDRYDTNVTGRLERGQLQKLLADLNDGHPPSDAEVDWLLSHGEQGVPGDPTSLGLHRDELRAAVTIWFHHVAPLDIHAHRGRSMLVPFVYTIIACVASSVVVAATTVLFSEEKTEEWLIAVGLTLVWRNFLIDPLKAVMFGRSFEFIFGMLFGGCAIDEAAAGVLQDEIEGHGDEFADGAADALNDIVDENMASQAEAQGGALADGAADAMNDVGSGGADLAGGAGADLAGGAGDLTAGAAGHDDQIDEDELDSIVREASHAAAADTGSVDASIPPPSAAAAKLLLDASVMGNSHMAARTVHGAHDTHDTPGRDIDARDRDDLDDLELVIGVDDSDI